MFIGKFLGKQTIFAHSAVGLLSIVEVCSWAVVLGALCLVEDAHGRELIESEVFEVEISFIVVLSLMLVHFAFNLMFLLFYYFTVI